MARRVEISIRGRSNYIKWSLYQWVLGFRDFLANEYGCEIDVKMVDGNEDYPVVIVDSVVINRYVFDEGFVLEAIKKALDGVCRRFETNV